jgi:hypothetical protein
LKMTIACKNSKTWTRNSLDSISFAFNSHSFDHDKLKKLIDYITAMPPQNATHQRGHK